MINAAGEDYWRFTSLAARKLFESLLCQQNMTIESHGNVLAANLFLARLISTELNQGRAKIFRS